MLKVPFQSCTRIEKSGMEDLLQQYKLTQIHVRVKIATCIIFTDNVFLKG